MVVSFINKQVLRTWGAKLVITFGVDKINLWQWNQGNTQFLFPEKHALASTEKSLIILHSALSFNLPLELHASEYESGHAIEFTSVIGIRNQGEISRSVWGYFEVVMTVRNATTMRIGVMIKTKKIPRTGGETENKSWEAKFIPTNSMLNFWTVKPGLKNESNVTPVRGELLKQYLLVYDWLSQPFCVVIRLLWLRVVSYYYCESQ